MANREKASRTYRDSSDDDVEILGSTQGSGAPGNFQSIVSSRTAKRAVAESSTRRHRYNYRNNIDAEDGNKDFVAYPPADNDDEDLSDVKVVEKANTKIQRRRVGTERGRGSATLASYANRTPVRSANKHQSQLSTNPTSSTKRTSVSSANKHQSQISFISPSKARTKHTVPSTIRGNRKIMTHGDDSDDDARGDVDRGASDSWGIASTITCPKGSVVDL